MKIGGINYHQSKNGWAVIKMCEFEIIDDAKMYEKCVVKILDMDEHDLVNLIKNIICKCPPSMKIVLKY